MNIIKSQEKIRDKFEGGYIKAQFEDHVSNCNQSEYAELFTKWLPQNQPILEAGAGIGIWVAWLYRKGFKCFAVDWSPELCLRALKKSPGAYFCAADLRGLPFTSQSIGSIVALGSVEHLIQGPEEILLEFRRVLNSHGIAIISVPYAGKFKRMVRIGAHLQKYLKAINFVRRIFNKEKLVGKTILAARRETRTEWTCDLHYSESGWHFYQYLFTKKQFRELLTATGFKVLDEAVIMKDSGVFNTFGTWSGCFNPLTGELTLTLFGKLLRGILPINSVGHMLCFVVSNQG